jgi:hypothetical protein
LGGDIEDDNSGKVGASQDCSGIASSLDLNHLRDMATTDMEVEMEEVQDGT